MKAIIVGAGLAGTSAAYTLKKAGWDVKLVEREDHVGGRANTVPKNGYLIDTAASAMATSYTSYLALAKEAGVADWVIPSSPYVGIVRANKIHELDMRRIQWSGLWTRLLSWRAKVSLIRLFRDAFLARARGMLNYNDLAKAAPIDVESASAYALRMFDQEINDYFCDPVVRVMLLADGNKVSKVDFFSGVANILDETMCSMRGGQQSFALHLAKGIPAELSCEATRVKEYDDRVEVSWKGPNGEVTETADACVAACQLHYAAAICEDYRKVLQPLNQKLRYTKAMSIAIGASTLVPTRAFMVFIPQREDPNIATLFLEHNKNPDRAPNGHSLLTAFLEESAAERCWNMSDEQIIQQTLDYLYRVFPSLRGKVDMTHVKRWSPALPLMQIGGYGEVARLHEKLKPGSRVQFAGDYLSGAGQNTAVDFGVKAARTLIANQKAPVGASSAMKTQTLKVAS